MSFKKTDLYKMLAKKVDGQMKTAGIPKRLAQGPVDAATRRGQAPRETPNRLVAVSCRLPADLVNRLRERAVGHEGGVNAILAQALERWLEPGHGG